MPMCKGAGSCQQGLRDRYLCHSVEFKEAWDLADHIHISFNDLQGLQIRLEHFGFEELRWSSIHLIKA